jgi:hypothetical protein
LIILINRKPAHLYTSTLTGIVLSLSAIQIATARQDYRTLTGILVLTVSTLTGFFCSSCGAKAKVFLEIILTLTSFFFLTVLILTGFFYLIDLIRV